MNDTLKSFLALGACIAVGLIGAGYLVSTTIYKGRMASNIVTVKGLAERDVAADLALWTLNFSGTGNDLGQANQKYNRDQEAVVNFLTASGFTPEEISTSPAQVTDLMAREYRSEGQLTGDRYILNGNVKVRSNDVEKVHAVSKKMGELIGRGVVLTASNYNTSNLPVFKFTKLNEVKPEMLKEATQNARLAAQQFANDSGSSVGGIQSASQGFFSIVSQDEQDGGGDYEAQQARDASINKRVRVVTTVTYYLTR